MQIEVDQSPRIEETNRPSVLAFSNNISQSILISSKTKQKAFQLLKLQGRAPITAKIMLFSTVLFLLIHNYLDKISKITIDIEYPGHAPDIKLRLLYLAEKSNKKLQPNQIQFQRVGKKSNAHLKAWSTYRGEQVPDQRIKFKRLRKLL